MLLFNSFICTSPYTSLDYIYVNLVAHEQIFLYSPTVCMYAYVPYFTLYISSFFIATKP